MPRTSFLILAVGGRTQEMEALPWNLTVYYVLQILAMTLRPRFSSALIRVITAEGCPLDEREQVADR